MTDPFLFLVDCKSSSAFLKKALELHYRSKGKYNLSDFSKKAGFTSRSFLSEVLRGKKRLSRDSLYRIRNTLKLPKLYLNYFDQLVYFENPSIGPFGTTSKECEKKLELLKKEIKYQSKKPKPKALWVSKPALYQTYAALGSLEKGASLKDIQTRLTLPKEQILQCLAALIKEGAVEKKGERYFALTSHLDLFGLKSNEGLSELVAQACEEIRFKRNRIIDGPENLIFYSAFSVKRKDLAALKQKMKNAFLDVLSEFQDDEGNTIRHLFFSMY